MNHRSTFVDGLSCAGKEPLIGCYTMHKYGGGER